MYTKWQAGEPSFESYVKKKIEHLDEQLTGLAKLLNSMKNGEGNLLKSSFVTMIRRHMKDFSNQEESTVRERISPSIVLQKPPPSRCVTIVKDKSKLASIQKSIDKSTPSSSKPEVVPKTENEDDNLVLIPKMKKIPKPVASDQPSSSTQQVPEVPKNEPNELVIFNIDNSDVNPQSSLEAHKIKSICYIILSYSLSIFEMSEFLEDNQFVLEDYSNKMIEAQFRKLERLGLILAVKVVDTTIYIKETRESRLSKLSAFDFPIVEYLRNIMICAKTLVIVQIKKFDQLHQITNNPECDDALANLYQLGIVQMCHSGFTTSTVKIANTFMMKQCLRKFIELEILKLTKVDGSLSFVREKKVCSPSVLQECGVGPELWKDIFLAAMQNPKKAKSVAIPAIVTRTISNLNQNISDIQYYARQIMKNFDVIFEYREVQETFPEATPPIILSVLNEMETLGLIHKKSKRGVPKFEFMTFVIEVRPQKLKKLKIDDTSLSTIVQYRSENPFKINTFSAENIQKYNRLLHCGLDLSFMEVITYLISSAKQKWTAKPPVVFVEKIDPKVEREIFEKAKLERILKANPMLDIEKSILIDFPVMFMLKDIMHSMKYPRIVLVNALLELEKAELVYRRYGQLGGGISNNKQYFVKEIRESELQRIKLKKPEFADTIDEIIKNPYNETQKTINMRYRRIQRRNDANDGFQAVLDHLMIEVDEKEGMDDGQEEEGGEEDEEEEYEPIDTLMEPPPAKKGRMEEEIEVKKEVKEEELDDY